MSSTARPVAAQRSAARPWIPRQHGAWPMLALPLLVGIALSRLSPWHLVLAVAAFAGYLAAAAAQVWLRSRRKPSYLPSLVGYGIAFGAASLALVVRFPALLLAGLVIGPAGALVIGGARPGTPRDLVNSLGQTAIAIVLAPAAVYVSGAWDPAVAVAATAVAGGYLVGTVLAVRSVIRERGNRAFAALSAGFHLVLTIAAAILLPWQYAAVAAGLAVRAVALPVVERRRAGTARPLRPIQVGIVEAVASIAVVLVAFAVPI